MTQQELHHYQDKRQVVSNGLPVYVPLVLPRGLEQL